MTDKKETNKMNFTKEDIEVRKNGVVIEEFEVETISPGGIILTTGKDNAYDYVRQGRILSVGENVTDYKPGEVVCYAKITGLRTHHYFTTSDNLRILEDKDVIARYNTFNTQEDGK